MKQPFTFIPLQKALPSVLALWILAMAFFVPANSNALSGEYQQEQSSFAGASYQDTADFFTAPQFLPKINAVFFFLPRLWEMLLLLNSPEIQKYQSLFLQFFLQKINFICVSTQAP